MWIFQISTFSPDLAVTGGVFLHKTYFFPSIRMHAKWMLQWAAFYLYLVEGENEKKKHCPRISKSKQRHGPAELACNLLVVAQTSMYTKVLTERDGRKRFTKCLQRTLQYSLLAVISSLCNLSLGTKFQCFLKSKSEKVQFFFFLSGNTTSALYKLLICVLLDLSFGFDDILIRDVSSQHFTWIQNHSCLARKASALIGAGFSFAAHLFLFPIHRGWADGSETFWASGERRHTSRVPLYEPIVPKWPVV